MWRDRLTEFADCLQLGILVCVAAVPVVTIGPSLAAGCQVVRRWRDGDSPPLLRTFAAEFRRQAGGGIPFTAGVLAVVLALSVDLALLGHGLPGARVLSVALPVLLAVLLVVAVRTCALVGAQRGWLAAARAAADFSLNPKGSLLLAAAVATAGVLVWLQPLMLLLVGGPLTLAAVGTTR
ncbi:DUF624 domain-containing protein [Crossiella sp. NPDC003009]